MTRHGRELEALTDRARDLAEDMRDLLRVFDRGQGPPSAEAAFNDACAQLAQFTLDNEFEILGAVDDDAQAEFKNLMGVWLDARAAVRV